MDEEQKVTENLNYNCSVKIHKDGAEVSLADIITEVLKMKKEEVNYELTPPDEIKINVNIPVGLYFLFSNNDGKEESLLYIGKSKTLDKRLPQHLIKVSEGTKSKLKDVQKELSKKANKILYYSVIPVEEESLAILEILLIRYAKKSGKYTSLWNKRIE